MLTDIKCKNAKPRAKPYKLSGGHGFYLHIEPNGRKTFRWNYGFNGKQKTLTYGRYPETSLKTALASWAKERALLLQGTDPAEPRKYFKDGDRPTFETVAREWTKKKSMVWVEKHATRVIQSLEKYLFPFIGSKPIGTIGAQDLLRVLRRIEDKGHFETALRARSIAGQVFRYGVSTGRCDRDVGADLLGALTVPKVQHMATITDPVEIGGLLRAIDVCQGQFSTHCALRPCAAFVCASWGATAGRVGGNRYR